MFFNNSKAKSTFLLLFAFIFTSFIISGCDQAKDAMDEAQEVVEKTGEVITETAEKTGEMAEDAVKKVGETTEKVVNKTVETADSIAEKVTDVVSNNFLVGVWTGKLDSRLTTLTITKQDGNNFEGKITISYRKPLNQDVKGTYNAETKVLTMEDQLHSRYKGKYSGKLSDDEKTYSGTFTTIVDKKIFNFSLIKK